MITMSNHDGLFAINYYVTYALKDIRNGVTDYVRIIMG